MMKQPGIDGRNRDIDGKIRSKNGNTLVDTLRDIYGENFAKGQRSDMKLETLLDRTGFKSLSEYLRKN